MTESTKVAKKKNNNVFLPQKLFLPWTKEK